MFSISAINDTDSRKQWQPLAPTKEAQEFHLSQLYHDGLLRLQAKEYEKARDLLESVLKDPLVSTAQVENSTSDGHLLQLRYLALKNLATVSLQQGPSYYENALHCYLQAIEIDNKDSVVWNQLGTLSCSMGSLSISRWAFEQGLVCSPNNWNCMEKLLEVLIAIGDEVACLSVAELILRHWPSHTRALHVKTTIEKSEPIPFTPRGIDKLEPTHKRLNFPEKRKAVEDNLDKAVSCKRLKQHVEIQLPESSWIALASELLEILRPLSTSCAESESYTSMYGTITIQLPPCSANLSCSFQKERCTSMLASTNIQVGSSKSKTDNEGTTSEGQPQERRSTRLRSRKSGKEESEFSSNKDHGDVVKRFLASHLVEGTGTMNFKANSGLLIQCDEVVSNSLDSESADIIEFIQNNSENCGAYHMAHLLLEKVATKGIPYKDNISMILDLEMLTRNWGQERTPECSLLLSELYFDIGSRSSEKCKRQSSMSEASYHLCKIIESETLEYPFHINGMSAKRDHLMLDASKENHPQPREENHYFLKNNHCFWIRFFWLSARLSLLEGDKEKSQKEFSVVLALFMDKARTSTPVVSIFLSHCKAIKKLTVERVLYEINLIEVDYLLKNSVNEMLEKNMHAECSRMLSPLLLLTNDVYLDVLDAWDLEGKRLDSLELSALDILIKSCEQAEPIDADVYMKCHKRRLQILLAGAGLNGTFSDYEPGSLALSSGQSQSKEVLKHCNFLVAEEVKAISQSASILKSIISPIENLNNMPIAVISDIQSLLLEFMIHIARKSSGFGALESVDPTDQCNFLDAAIALCKLQHLNFNVPIKSQTELIVAIHEMLAEFGMCCARGNDDEEEGTFLKLAIKHLLFLDMKLKTSVNKGQKVDKQGLGDSHIEMPAQPSHDIHLTRSPHESLSQLSDTIMDKTNEKASVSEKNFVESLCSETVSSDVDANKVGTRYHNNDIEKEIFLERMNDITEDEREELELNLDSALDQCFYCLYGLNLRSDSSSEEDLVTHKNTCQGDYQTKEQCADVFQYILPYAKVSSKTGLIKLRKVLRAIRKHFQQPPDNVLAGNAIDKFLDDPELCEEKLLEEVRENDVLDTTMKIIFPDDESLKEHKTSTVESSDPYLEVYCNLYYLLAQSEEMSATDKWAGFALTKEGEDFVQHNADLFKYDLLYNPIRFESWQRLANIYDEEVDLLLNDGSKQINVLGWRKNATLPQRVEASRRRSRRCLLMTSALANTALQQGEIHELLALVYYDGLQNVVPFYDQRSIIPSKDAAWKKFCENSMSHFNEARILKEDWSHAFYVGKLCEKLAYTPDVSFSYYAQAIALNPTAVDPFYRMHASRLKFLYKCGKQNEVILKVIATYSFSQAAKEIVTSIFNDLGIESSDSSMHVKDGISSSNFELVDKLEKIWNVLYDDCLSALETCVEGDLKHFHKARYMLAQGYYKRGGIGDLEKAKDELSFCFKSSRSSFTINMWEIDSTVKKGRRKGPAPSGNRRALEVNLAESSRKFITCIRKYILFYLKLLEETGDISTLERAYISLRADKRFSLCVEDLVPLTLGTYIKVLTTSIRQAGYDVDSVEHLLEKLFNLFLEQVNLWSDLCSLPELKSPELTENSLYGYLYQYIQLLERNVKIEALEGINEKIRKRLKNPKLSNSHCAKVYRHVSAAWCRSLVISMTLITPLHSRLSTDLRGLSLLDGESDSAHLLCVDLQSEELWSSAFEDPNHLKILETKWNTSLSKIKNVIIKKVPDEDLESAATILKSSYNFYKDTSCALLPSGINLYMVPVQLATETYIDPGIDGVDILDMNTSRKLLLWAYSLLHGHCTNVSHVTKYCEENAKTRMRKGTGGSFTPSHANMLNTATPSQPGGGIEKVSEQEVQSPFTMSASLPESISFHKLASSISLEAEKIQSEPTTLFENVNTQNKAICSETDGKCVTDLQAGPSGPSKLSLPDYGDLNA